MVAECRLCGRSGGNPLLGDVAGDTHPLCLAFVRGPRGAVGGCVFCGREGATAGCGAPGCAVVFHLPCSLGRPVLHSWQRGYTRCAQHAPVQKGQRTGKCGVCGWRVGPVSALDGLITPCCGIPHHRACLQVVASLGNHLCPSCADSQTFKTEMVFYGIYFKVSTDRDYPKLDSSSSEVDLGDLSAEEKEQRGKIFSSTPAGNSKALSNRDSGIALTPSIIQSTCSLTFDSSIEFGASSECHTQGKRKSVTEAIVQKRPKFEADLSEVANPLPEHQQPSSNISPLPLPDSLTDSSLQSFLTSTRNTTVESRVVSLLVEDEEDFSDMPLLSDQSAESVNLDINRSMPILSDNSLYIREDEEKEVKTSSLSPQTAATNKESELRENLLKKPPPREEEILELRRKENLRKIQKRPLRERLVLQGHNFLPWDQEAEEYCEAPTDWYQEEAERQIDDFTDVNTGEKLMMKLWNRFARSLPRLGVLHLPAALVTFARQFGPTLLRNNLYRNFLLHLAALESQEVISGAAMLQALVHLQQSAAQPATQQSCYNTNNHQGTGKTQSNPSRQQRETSVSEYETFLENKNSPPRRLSYYEDLAGAAARLGTDNHRLIGGGGRSSDLIKRP